MTDTQIESFLELAKTRNYTKAAENLCTMQPNITRRVIKLEEELGTKLVLRDRKVTLTEAGKQYRDFFTKMKNEFEVLQKQIKNEDAISTPKDTKKDTKKVRPYDPIWDMYLDEFEDDED